MPGELFVWVKRVSYFELVIFLGLLFFWIAPGYHEQTSLFGLAHGLGYLALCALIFAAIIRRQAPWPLFAATLTPFATGQASAPPRLSPRRKFHHVRVPRWAI